jgi:chromosome segregation ATPase
MQILRDIFTFGLGELGDWGGLNAQIDYANKLIQSCQNDLNTCQAALREAEQAISKIDSEIAQYSQLQTSLNAYLPRPRELKQQADDLRQRNQETCNKSLDIAGFLSVLAAKGEALQLGLTAQDFAQRVLAVQTALNGKRPQGLMWDQPGQLQSTLEMIASSSVPAVDLGDLM